MNDTEKRLARAKEDLQAHRVRLNQLGENASNDYKLHLSKVISALEEYCKQLEFLAALER